MASKYKIRMGLPQMSEYWDSMQKKQAEATLSKDENELFSKVQKAIRLLKDNPSHPGLGSHDIDVLTAREGFRVYESYLENNTPAAGRMFWAYGPNRGDITILGIVPHPSKSGYKRVPLSSKPKNRPLPAAGEEKQKDPKKGKGLSKKMK